MSGGAFSVPLVIRTTIGAGTSSAAQPPQNLQAMFLQVPGLKIAVPSCPRSATWGTTDVTMTRRNDQAATKLPGAAIGA